MKITQPTHYTIASVTVEPVELCERLGFCLGNVVKYLSRRLWKGDELNDLTKARYYWQRYLDHENEREDVISGDPVVSYLFERFSERETLLAELYTSLCLDEDKLTTQLDAAIARLESIQVPEIPTFGDEKDAGK